MHTSGWPNGILSTVHVVLKCCCLQKVQEHWYESLHDWEAAYKAYQERQQQRPDDISLTLGKMRCLHAMGEW